MGQTERRAGQGVTEGTISRPSGRRRRPAGVERSTLNVRPERLNRIRWKGEQTYRVLSYYFALRWNHVRAGDYATLVLADFAVPPDPWETRNPPTPNLPPRYSIVDLGPKEPGRYRLLYGVDTMHASEKMSEVIAHLLRHINVESMRQTGDFLLIHAGAVATPDGEGLLLPGQSGSGKTTLVTALVLAGFGYLSDEAGAIDPVSRRLHPHPRALSMKSPGTALFPGLSPRLASSGMTNGEWHVRPEELRPHPVGKPCDVRFVIAPRYRPGVPTELVPLSTAEATVQLAMNAANLPLYRARGLPLLAEVARGAACYQLDTGDLREAVRAVATATEIEIATLYDGMVQPT